LVGFLPVLRLKNCIGFTDRKKDCCTGGGFCLPGCEAHGLQAGFGSLIRKKTAVVREPLTSQKRTTCTHEMTKMRKNPGAVPAVTQKRRLYD
jgi:hypothetical protein